MGTTISTRIRALPQELQDQILNHLLDLQPHVVNLMDKPKFPIGLHLNRAIRKSTAARYYGACTFESTEQGMDWGGGYKWLAAIPPAHRRLIKTLLIEVPDNLTHFHYDLIINSVFNETSMREVRVEKAVVKLKLVHPELGSFTSVYPTREGKDGSG